jgi:hypothetical protein
MNQNGLGLNMVVETNLSVNEFNDKFIEWIESNNWVCCGSIYSIDEDGNKILDKKKYTDNCK